MKLEGKYRECWRSRDWHVTRSVSRSSGCLPSAHSTNAHLRHLLPRTTRQLMEDAEKSEGGERESPPLRIDPKWYAQPLPRPDCCPLTGRSLQDALRTFFQPIKTDDPRVDFYTMYKREAAEYDTDYVKKYDEDLNTTLIFVRYFKCHPISSMALLTPIGRAVLCSQLRLRHRRPFESPTRSQ